MTQTQPTTLASLSLEEMARRCVARFRDRKADWNAFADAQVDGYRRAQHRFIGAGGSGKYDDPSVIPAGAWTSSSARGSASRARPRSCTASSTRAWSRSTS